MSDRYDHPTMEPISPLGVLRWLHDGYGGHISEDAQQRIRHAIHTLEQIDDALWPIRYPGLELA